MLCSAFPLESGAAYVSSCHRLPVFPRGLAAALGTPAGPEMLYGEGPGTQHKPSPEGVLANGPWRRTPLPPVAILFAHTACSI